MERAGNPNYYQRLERMADLHHSKNLDYCGPDGWYQGMDNFVQAAAYAGCSVRTVFRVMQGIKLARRRALESSQLAANHESLADTALDLANYQVLESAFADTYDWIDVPLQQMAVRPNLEPV
ncbi:MAG TPA: hypothetical protein VLH56_19305 [Dissulfurispiraceae bacterium]|nr:hypothetical protein [Dissulfurispiraceae bacterium]